MRPAMTSKVTRFWRRADERDNRLVRLWLTDAGRALRPPVERERRLLEQALAASLTGEERAHLVSALTKIHRAAAGILAAAGTASW